MIESLVILGKVAVVCGASFAVATGFEWFSDMEIKPKKNIIRLGGKEKQQKEVSSDGDEIKHIRQAARQKG